MYQHGGDIYSYPDMLDFSANINPLGIPEQVKEAYLSSLEELTHYPDPKCRMLREAIGRKHEIPASFILCGNGAADLIFTLCFALKPKRALLPAPSFSEYARALSCIGCSIQYSFLPEKDRFAFTEQFLSDLKSFHPDIIFLCNPNNPTGQLIDHALLTEIAAYCERQKIYIVIDECFLDFTDAFSSGSLIPKLPVSNYLFILKAFTKMYALPGLRLGYFLSGNADLLRKMQSFRQPWSVSVPAQAAGTAAYAFLKEHNWEEKTRQFIKKERAFLKNSLPFSNITGEANYLFFPSHLPLSQIGRERGILIRCCNNFISLEQKNYYRIAVKTREENTKFLRLLFPEPYTGTVH